MTCSSTCGEGVMRRDRSCSDPAPLGKGEVCGGYGTETRHCFQRPCASNTPDHFYVLLVFHPRTTAFHKHAIYIQNECNGIAFLIRGREVMASHSTFLLANAVYYTSVIGKSQKRMLLYYCLWTFLGILVAKYGPTPKPQSTHNHNQKRTRLK